MSGTGHTLRPVQTSMYVPYLLPSGSAIPTILCQLSSRVHLAISTKSAVKTLHEQNIVHRDIKLANILLTTKFVAKLSDFGFAKAQ